MGVVRLNLVVSRCTIKLKTERERERGGGEKEIESVNPLEFDD